MIIVKEKGVELPGAETIYKCADVNRDGIGVAWVEGGILRIKKDFPETEDFMLWAYQNLTKDIPAVVHFRLATHGLNDMGNRHPFPVSQNVERLRGLNIECDVAVAHNGVMSEFKHEELSDTMLFIKEILADDVIRPNIQSMSIQRLIAGYVGNHNKFAFINRDGNIGLIGKFVKSDGLYYSNEGFRIYNYERKNGVNSYLAGTTPIGCEFKGMSKLEACCFCGVEGKRKRMTRVGYLNDQWPDWACSECYKDYELGGAIEC